MTKCVTDVSSKLKNKLNFILAVLSEYLFQSPLYYAFYLFKKTNNDINISYGSASMSIC